MISETKVGQPMAIMVEETGAEVRVKVPEEYPIEDLKYVITDGGELLNY
jgi:hypothetical protein